eukprot:TRINITY_DN114579_c0_g1_i1.p1 TRINITY_DN114579_c0_g1~~TRINITY_DN114579_c0_g1_i1.p1  ORF type:complete len:586 (+),score=187.03 TRINITY_DN114579_c0_g1_i1:72-1829(+)
MLRRFMALRLVALLASSCLPAAAASNSFLARSSLTKLAEEVDPQLLHKLVAEVESALGGALRNDTKGQLKQIEAMVRPTFKALPKNEHGKLDHSAVKYALHRLFVQRHGWVIRGFQSDAEAEAGQQPLDNSSASLSTSLLQGRVPDLVQEVFEARVGDEGSSLEDVALLGALLEHLIREDMRTRLRDVYTLSGFAVDQAVDSEQAGSIISLYMMLFIQGYTDFLETDREHLEAFIEHFSKIYPPWPQTHRLLQEAQETVARGLTSFSFEDIVRVLSEAANHFYDHVHHTQCQLTKDMLLEMEFGEESGRVRLLDFYRAALYEHKYQFTETIDYMRQIGVLDESDTLTPKVIIPNYVSGPSNCIARTSYYAVCCPDACESHFDHLEHVLGRPEATKGEILAVVQEGRSAPISELLLRRLDDIAAHHGGKVPLHGRLFSQWMHFVYPSSCVYPHVSGTTYTKTMEEFEEDTGLRTGSTMDELTNWAERLHEHLQAAEGQAATGGSADMWTMEEELVVKRKDAAADAAKAATDSQTRSTAAGGSKTLQGLVLLVLFGGVFAFLKWGGPGAAASKSKFKGFGQDSKHFV